MRHFNSYKLLILVTIIGTLLVAYSKGKTSTKIDINTATTIELQSIPGIGPSYASRIIDERELRGGFRTVKDLLKVRGIGRKTLARIEPYIKVTPLKGKSKQG